MDGGHSFFDRNVLVCMDHDASEKLHRAIDLHRLHGLSFWDALVVRAALVSGCSRLLSEDLQTGRRFEGLEVVNPFS